MGLYKSKMFSWLGPKAKSDDVNKDVNNKGTVERFIEEMGYEHDTYLIPKISELTKNTRPFDTLLAEFIPFMESLFGGQFFLTEEVDKRRFLRYYDFIQKWRGTEKALRVLFNLLNISMTLTEHQAYYTFDDPTVTFDDPFRKFDKTKCQDYCSDYSLELTGSDIISPELAKRVLEITRYNEPIFARLREITYNGDPLVSEIVTVYIDEFGDLIYENTYDPELTLEIANEDFDPDNILEGDLIISGPNAHHYSIVAGDLIYTI